MFFGWARPRRWTFPCFHLINVGLFSDESMQQKMSNSAPLDTAKPACLMIAGFGDDASMYDGLMASPLADGLTLIPLDLPGFGAPALEEPTSLVSLAHFVAEQAQEAGAEILIAHSVASIVASLAAGLPQCPVTQIVSLEGNLTAEDAYFSGSAAQYASPGAFRDAFLARLAEMAETDPIIARYRAVVECADEDALYALGCDAHQFSQDHCPGDVLQASAQVTYVYSPANCPEASVKWLEKSGMKSIRLEGVSHWSSVDSPSLIAKCLLDALNLS